MLAGIIWLWYLYAASPAGGGAGTFDYALILNALQQGQLTLVSGGGVATQQQAILFGLFALAFCIKVPLFPLHTWLPDAHTEAPTAGSVILAGVLLKMGTYGFLRFSLPLFPAASVFFAPMLLVLATIGIIYGAVVAALQPNLTR